MSAIGVAHLRAACADVDPPQTSADEISSQAEDPTAPLRTYEINDWYNATLHDRAGSINQVVGRLIVPFGSGEMQHLARLTVPGTTSQPSGKTGLGDTELLELTGWKESWRRFGVGLEAQLPTGADGVTSNKWSAGPAAGLSITSDPKNRWGFLLRTYWSFAGAHSAKNVGIINLQPVYTLQLGGGRTLSLGQSQIVYDTAASRWKSLQLGIKFGGVSTFGLVTGLKWKPSVEVDYDFRKLPGNPAWTVRIAVSTLAPKLL